MKKAKTVANKYHYFVAYTFGATKNEKSVSGHGYVGIQQDTKMDTLAEVNDTAKTIELNLKNDGYVDPQVTILNWKRLKKNKEK